MIRFWPVFFSAVALLCTAAGKKKIQSPKASDPASVIGLPMVRSSLALPRNTNRVFRLNFSWDYDTNSLPRVDSFVLNVGTEPGNYSWFTNTGMPLSFEFRMTNWNEASLRHYYAISAKGSVFEGPVSNEVHYPPYPPDHVRILWENVWSSASLFTSTDLVNWNLIADVSNTNKFETFILNDTSAHFFRLDKPDRLQIQPFNPSP